MNRGRMNLLVVLLTVLLHITAVHAQRRYPANGLVLSVDRSQKTIVVSCDEIPGLMDAMVMPFKVRDAKALDQIERGSLVDFLVVANKGGSYAENIRLRGYSSTEREPSKSRRLRGLSEDLRGPMHRLAVGQSVPDFILTDQKKRPVRLSQFAGKVVALNFVYTRCALPEYCFRSSNNFGILQKRYPERLGSDLILLSVTFDPVHDQPDVLQSYAKTWKADAESWRFLTGAAADVQRVCDLFGVHFVPDEGLFIHSLHTAIIGRDGKLVADLEGNGFTGQQLADLVKTVLDPGKT
jgi:protein SCO1/2